MDIVVLDGRTLSDCALNFDEFASFGKLTVYDITKPEEVARRIKNAEVIICNKSALNAELLEQAPKLKYIGVMATGYDNIDTKYCAEHGISVCNAGTYSTDNVAQQVFAFILNKYTRVADYDRFVKSDGWKNAPSFSPLEYRTNVISEKTLGIVGFGNIGRAVAKIALAFGMRVLVNTRTPKNISEVEFCDFDYLCKNSDIITLHCPLTDKTRNLFNRNVFKNMKKSAFLINTSRGPVVNEEDLYHALKNGEIAAAATDVLSKEPMAKECKLCELENITITPHIAWASDEAKQRLYNITLSNFKNWLAGKPAHEVQNG